MVYIRYNKKDVVFCRERWWESIVSDLFTFFIMFVLLYITHHYFGNSWIILCMMAIFALGLFFRKPKFVSKYEFLKIVKNELKDVVED